MTASQVYNKAHTTHETHLIFTRLVSLFLENKDKVCYNVSFNSVNRSHPFKMFLKRTDSMAEKFQNASQGN